MREYFSDDTKPMKRSTKIMAVIAGFVLIFLGIIGHSFYSIVVGVILLVVMVLRKTISVNEEGLAVVYDMVLYKSVALWKWDEIKEIHTEVSPDGTKLALHFMQDIMSRRLIYSFEDADKVINLALEKNPKIHVAEVDK